MTSEVREVNFPPAAPVEFVPLSALEARVLGCLIEKELATPDVYPLTTNALVNACNQRSNRDPVIETGSREVELAIEALRTKSLAVRVAGGDARVAKFKQRLEVVYPMDQASRALLGELLLRGPQTAAGLRGNAERLCDLPPVSEIEILLGELAGRLPVPLVRRLARQPGQKEARWTQLLTGEPSPDSERTPVQEPLQVTVALAPETEQRLAKLEAIVAELRTELATLRKALGE